MTLNDFSSQMCYNNATAVSALTSGAAKNSQLLPFITQIYRRTP